MNDRESYRIVYPEQARPRLRVIMSSAIAAPVLECSEGGLRFRIPATWPSVVVGAIVRANVEFHPSPPVGSQRTGVPRLLISVNGRVIRTEAQTEGHTESQIAVVQLDRPGIPFSVLLREQRALLGRYPDWLTASAT